MCKYIIMEDFSMGKYIYDNKNGLWYELQEDYYIPCLILPVDIDKQAQERMERLTEQIKAENALE